MAYVGGGFGVNVHSTIEPAVYGIPVLFGPRFHNSPDAEGLVATGGGIVVQDQMSLFHELSKLIIDVKQRKEIGKIAGRYIKERSGATKHIVEDIEYKKIDRDYD